MNLQWVFVDEKSWSWWGLNHEKYLNILLPNQFLSITLVEITLRQGHFRHSMHASWPKDHRSVSASLILLTFCFQLADHFLLAILHCISGDGESGFGRSQFDLCLDLSTRSLPLHQASKIYLLNINLTYFSATKRGILKFREREPHIAQSLEYTNSCALNRVALRLSDFFPHQTT